MSRDELGTYEEAKEWDEEEYKRICEHRFAEHYFTIEERKVIEYFGPRMSQEESNALDSALKKLPMPSNVLKKLEATKFVAKAQKALNRKEFSTWSELFKLYQNKKARSAIGWWKSLDNEDGIAAMVCAFPDVFGYVSPKQRDLIKNKKGEWVPDPKNDPRHKTALIKRIKKIVRKGEEIIL